MLFRIGINLGEVVVKGNDLLGDGVNVAARLQSIAPPGGILVSSSVYDQITGKLDLGFQDMGEQELKNISRPIRAFSVSGAGQPLRKVTLGGEAATGKRPRARRRDRRARRSSRSRSASAWQQGWIGAPRPPEARVAAPDPAKAKLEADLAASEKARAQAELRATTSDADAIRARASADAAALRAKAETEAADTKAKAQSEAAALRGKATQEATRSKASDADAIRARAEADAAALTSKAASDAAAAKAKAEADIAAMQAKAAQDAKAAQEAAAAAKAAQDALAAKAAQDAAAKAAAAPAAEASRNDGSWVMTQQCSANQFSPGFTRSADFVVRGGEFTIERGAPGQPGYNITRGRPSADGTLVLAGNGIGSQGRGTGQPFEIRLDGRWTGDRYVLRGTWGGRLCDGSRSRVARGRRVSRSKSGACARSPSRARSCARDARSSPHGLVRVRSRERPRDRAVVADRLRRAAELGHGDRAHPVVQVARLGDDAPDPCEPARRDQRVVEARVGVERAGDVAARDRRGLHVGDRGERRRDAPQSSRATSRSRIAHSTAWRTNSASSMRSSDRRATKCRAAGGCRRALPRRAAAAPRGPACGSCRSARRSRCSAIAAPGTMRDVEDRAPQRRVDARALDGRAATAARRSTFASDRAARLIAPRHRAAPRPSACELRVGQIAVAIDPHRRRALAARCASARSTSPTGP